MHQTPAELCKCKLCDQNLVEDEIHFVTVCEKYMPLRIDLYTLAKSVCSGFRCMSSHEQFHMLPTNDDDKAISAFAKYCHKAFKLRSEVLDTNN